MSEIILGLCLIFLFAIFVLFLYCVMIISKEVDSMYQCFHCLNNSLIWQSDYSYEDYGYEGDGIVQILICSNCGAEVEYRIPIKEED